MSPRLFYVTTAQTDLEGWVGDARIPQDGSAACEDQAAEGALPVKLQLLVQIQASTEVFLLRVEGVYLGSTGAMLLPLVLPGRVFITFGSSLT